MAQIITIANQKGGVGKTTTALALISGLVKRGYKVLAIDLDAQTNLSLSTGATGTNGTTLEVMEGKIPITQAIEKTEITDIVPASQYLVTAERELGEVGKEYKLKEALEPIKKQYDYIIIDTPPALSILTTNALATSNKVVITAQADLFSIQGISQLSQTIEAVKKYCNPKLKIDGILLTMYSQRNKVQAESRGVIEGLAKMMQTKIYKSAIRTCTKAREVIYRQTSIEKYAPKQKVVEDYNGFIEELLNGK